MKSTGERIADLEKAINDLSNRYTALEDRVRAAETAVADFQALSLAVDNMTIKANLLGI